MGKELHQHLQEYGVKPSPQRLAIMTYLLEHRTHPTADEIFNALSPDMPTLSKTTVYNTLNLLAARGVILSLDLDSRETHYDGDASAHAHFLCTMCGKIHDLPIPAVNLVSKDIDPSFQISEVQVYYKGICCNCTKAAAAKKPEEKKIN